MVSGMTHDCEMVICLSRRPENDVRAGSQRSIHGAKGGAEWRPSSMGPLGDKGKCTGLDQ